MKNRRGFLTALTALSTAGAAAVVSAKSRAQTPAPAAAPSSSAKPHQAPSAAALAIAATYRGFDPRLSDAEIATIARGIDDNRATAASLRAKRAPLRNADEPVTRYAAAERIAE